MEMLGSALPVSTYSIRSSLVVLVFGRCGGRSQSLNLRVCKCGGIGKGLFLVYWCLGIPFSIILYIGGLCYSHFNPTVPWYFSLVS